MRKLHLLFLFSGLICFSCMCQSKTQEKTDLKTIKTDTLRTENGKQEKEIVKKISIPVLRSVSISSYNVRRSLQTTSELKSGLCLEN